MQRDGPLEQFLVSFEIGHGKATMVVVVMINVSCLQLFLLLLLLKLLFLFLDCKQSALSNAYRASFTLFK